MEIAKYLKHGTNAATVDSRIFRGYEEKVYGLKHTLVLFKENNEIEEEIDLEEFKQWMMSLGYSRKER